MSVLSDWKAGRDLFPPQLVEVYGDDWAGVYCDGKLIEQGHSVGGIRLCASLGFMTAQYEASPSWLDERGELPDSLADVVFNRPEDTAKWEAALAGK